MSARSPNAAGAPAPRPNFDRIAPLYRWLEYASLGRALERARLHHLPALPARRRALLLGDGDGRFTAQLLARQPWLSAQAVDLSPAMLRLLVRRVAPAARARLQTVCADARDWQPEIPCDLLVTHFFLDCLTTAEVAALVHRLATTSLAPGALWLLSEFRIPDGTWGWAARVYVRLLYAAFRVLTGLRVTALPDFRDALHTAGFKRLAVKHSLGGLLTAELWQLAPAAQEPVRGKA